MFKNIRVNDSPHSRKLLEKSLCPFCVTDCAYVVDCNPFGLEGDKNVECVSAPFYTGQFSYEVLYWMSTLLICHLGL